MNILSSFRVGWWLCMPMVSKKLTAIHFSSDWKKLRNVSMDQCEIKWINCCASIRKSFKFSQKSYAGDLYKKFNWKIITTYVCFFVSTKAVLVFTLIKTRITLNGWVHKFIDSAVSAENLTFKWHKWMDQFLWTLFCGIVVWVFDPSI